MRWESLSLVPGAISRGTLELPHLAHILPRLVSVLVTQKRQGSQDRKVGRGERNVRVQCVLAPRLCHLRLEFLEHVPGRDVMGTAHKPDMPDGACIELGLCRCYRFGRRQPTYAKALGQIILEWSAVETHRVDPDDGVLARRMLHNFRGDTLIGHQVSS